MRFRRDLLGADEHASYVLRYLVDALERPLRGDLLQDLVVIQPEVLQFLRQNRIHLDEFRSVHDVADERVGKYRLDAGRAS